MVVATSTPVSLGETIMTWTTIMARVVEVLSSMCYNEAVITYQVMWHFIVIKYYIIHER